MYLRPACCVAADPHVPDDLEAMLELQRILSPGGLAVLMVPRADHPAVKVELPRNASAADQLRLAGQEHHQRIHRSDFMDHLTNADFHVAVIDESSFECLRPPVYSHPLATNYRKIYFARRRVA